MNAPFTPRIEDLAAGTRIKSYRLLERIGYGGQAIIWSAYDEAQGTVVAIRFDQAAEGGESDLYAAHQAFMRQTQLVASLAHPNILPIHDFGVADRLQFIVMPYLAGGALSDWLAAGRLTVSQCAQVISQIASALDYLHQRQIIHRDLKPTNILLDCYRNVYLADFGLARVLSASTQVLHTGHGTPPYAPPEQHLSSKLTAQSDLYSLGILFYELLTGQLPWRGAKSLGLQQISDPNDSLPDPQILNPDVPRELVPVLWSLTATAPAARPPSAAAARQLIEGALPKTIGAAPAATAPPSFDAPAEAAELLRLNLAAWQEGTSAAYPLSLTRFALIDAVYQSDRSALPGDLAHRLFMLCGALLYRQRPAYWWAQVAEPEQKVSVCVRLLAAKHYEVLDSLVAAGAAQDAALRSWAAGQPLTIWVPIIQAVREAQTPARTERILAMVEQIAPASAGWRRTSFSPEIDRWLGELALGQASYSPQALRLIGRVRSEGAVDVLLGDADEQHEMDNLMRLSALAGNVPGAVPAPVKRRLLATTVSRQLSRDPAALLRAYALSVLGAALGFGSYIFWSYRLPTFMDTTRWLVALERGIFLGVFVGFGIFVTRVFIQRLTSLARGPRFAAGVISGSLALLVAFLGYDVLFLDILPVGWLFQSTVCRLKPSGLSAWIDQASGRTPM